MVNWQEIVQELGPIAYQTSWRILGHAQDCEDVLQEVFIEAFRYFESGKVRNPKAFLYRLVTFRSLDTLRRRKVHSELDASQIIDKAMNPLDQVVEKDEDNRLRTIVAGLPSRQAAVFCLTYFEGLSADEIASTLEISTNAVGMALFKARAKLQSLVTKESTRNEL